MRGRMLSLSAHLATWCAVAQLVIRLTNTATVLSSYQREMQYSKRVNSKNFKPHQCLFYNILIELHSLHHNCSTATVKLFLLSIKPETCPGFVHVYFKHIAVNVFIETHIIVKVKFILRNTFKKTTFNPSQAIDGYIWPVFLNLLGVWRIYLLILQKNFSKFIFV